MLAKDLFFINSRCKGILDAVKNEIIVINQSNEILFANKSAVKLLGKNSVNKKIDNFLHKDEIKKFNESKKKNETISLSINSKIYDLFIKKEDEYFILTFEDYNYVENYGKVELMNKMINLFSSEKDLTKIFQKTIEYLIDFFGFEYGGIYLVENEYLVLKAQKNLHKNFVKKVSKISIHEKRYKSVFEKNSCSIINYEKFNPKRFKETGIRLLISIPMINEKKVIGIINIASKENINVNKKIVIIIENLANNLSNIVKKFELDNSSKLNEYRFNAISHITDEFILIIDKKGEITYSSRSFSKLGYSREELIGLKFGKICKNYSKDMLKKNKIVFNIVDSIGTIHLFETSINTIISDKSIVLLSRDITEKKTFEEILKNEKNKLQQYLDNIPMIFLALNIEGNIQMINQTGCSILKGKKEDIIGKNWFNTFLKPNDKKLIKQKFFKAIYGEKKEYDELISNLYENKIMCLNKEIKLIEWNNSLIRNEKGILNMIIAVGRDVTQEKEKEQEIEMLKKNNELSDMRKNFLMLVTHELKQPLTPIMGYADLLKENIVDIEKLKYLDRIINGGQDMLDLITRIINLMKLESGELMFNYKEISILKIIEEALRKKASLINLKSIRIEKKIKDVNFTGDFNLLRDVILNLIDNAVKFSNEKAIITIKTNIVKNNLIIKIIDQGIGMEKEDAENLFKSFKQSEIGRKKGGFGIGLAMSKMIVEKHNGIIYAESKPGKGSTFIVSLPIKKNR